MKNTLFIAIFAFLIFSCTKEHSANTISSAKKYKVSFNIANFVSQQGVFSLKQHNYAISHQAGGPVSASLTDVGDYLDVLYYYVFDSNGYVVSRLKQDSTAANFGNITDSLKVGHYTVIIAAGKKGLVPTVSTLPNSYINYSGFNWQDTFYINLPFDVSSPNISQDVTLKRIVGKVELQLLDAIPSNAYRITLNVYPEYDRYNFNEPGAGVFRTDTVGITHILTPSDKGHTGFTLDKIIGNTFSNCTVTITCKDASGKIIAQAKTPGVSIAANAKTLLLGNLFAGSNAVTQSFQVKIDTAWNSTPINSSF